jgi:hypothetical protein
LTCQRCGAVSVEDGEGSYISHYHDCPYRRTSVPPRRTLRDRGGDLISDARYKLDDINWAAVVGVVLLALIVTGVMWLFFEWLEHMERYGGR